MTAIRAALFDFGGVLVDSPLAAFAAEEDRLGLPAGSISRVVVAGGEAGPWARLERGELALEPFLEVFGDELAREGISADVARIMDAFGQLRVRDEVVAAVRRAHGRVRTALITNNWRQHGMAAAIEGLEELFDLVVESHVEGIRKPDPRIYHLACARLGVEPKEAVFLDDLGVNLKSARALGMTTIKVDSPGEAVAELERVLVERAA